MKLPEATTITPVRTPVIDPATDPERRLDPDEICPNQKERVTKRVIEDI